MKNKFAALALAALTAAQLGVSAFAENGPWTTDHPFAWGVTSFPFRMATSGIGIGFGALAGGVKGIVETERKFAEHTWDEADKNPIMVPVGLVGSVVAIPVGFLIGAPEGAAEWAKSGYTYWDRF